MDVFKNLDEYLKKDFNKSTIVQINNNKYIYPYNFINNNIISDSSLNKYYKYCIKNQTFLVHDNKVFDMIEQLDNQKAFEQLRLEREKEKKKIYQNLFNKDNKKDEQFEEYNNINLNNFLDKLRDKKNTEDQGYNIIYSIMKLLKNRKKVHKKKIFTKMNSLLEQKKNFYINKYNELFNSPDNDIIEKNSRKLNKVKKIKFNEMKMSKSENPIKENENENENENNFLFYKTGEIKKDNNFAENIKDAKDEYSKNNILCFSEKKSNNNKLNISNYIKRKDSLPIEKKNDIIRNLFSEKKTINDKIIYNQQDLFKYKLNKINKINKINKLNKIKSFPNFSNSLSKNLKDENALEKIKNERNNNQFSWEKINKYENIKQINSLILDNKSFNKNSFGNIHHNKIINKKLLLDFNIKEKEIKNKAQELLNLINNNYKKKEKINYENKNNKKLKYNYSQIDLKKEIEKYKRKKHKNKHKDNNRNKSKIEYNINHIIYENKGKYKLGVTNKYIFPNNEPDSFDNLKNYLVYEVKKQLIKKNTNDLVKINKNEIIKKLNKKFRLTERDFLKNSLE